MAQAATITEAQLRRVLQYVSTRRHALRDRTILLVSFNAGLRAKEIAALLVGDIYDDAGAVREQFILRRAQTKGGYERTVWRSGHTGGQSLVRQCQQVGCGFR